MSRKNLDFKFEIKELPEESGSFVGLASVYGRVDLAGEVVERGAFSRTLSDRGAQVPILYQHDPREPIGLGKLEDTKSGLLIRGKLTMASPVAQKAYALLKDGVLKGLSIGYETLRDEIKGPVRYLKEIKLWEVSLVTFPCMEQALVSSVKAVDLDEEVDPGELKALFSKFSIQQKGFSV